MLVSLSFSMAFLFFLRRVAWILARSFSREALQPEIASFKSSKGSCSMSIRLVDASAIRISDCNRLTSSTVRGPAPHASCATGNITGVERPAQLKGEPLRREHRFTLCEKLPGSTLSKEVSRRATVGTGVAELRFGRLSSAQARSHGVPGGKYLGGG